MKSALALAGGATLALLICGSASAQDVLHARNPHWLGFAAQPTSMESGPYRFTQEYDPSSFTGQIYVQRNQESQPRLIFTNPRYAEILVGHRGRRVLINCYVATKEFDVYSADVDTGERRRIDQQALRMFSKNSNASPFLIIVADAEAFSPDDREALLSLTLMYVSASTREEAARAEKTFKKWWYAVSTADGKVLHEYRVESVPRAWRTAYRETGSDASRLQVP